MFRIYQDTYEIRIFALFSRGLVVVVVGGGVCCEKTIFISFLLISRQVREIQRMQQENRIRIQTLPARVEIRDVQVSRVPRQIQEGLRDWT